MRCASTRLSIKQTRLKIGKLHNVISVFYKENSSRILLSFCVFCSTWHSHKAVTNSKLPKSWKAQPSNEQPAFFEVLVIPSPPLAIGINFQMLLEFDAGIVRQEVECRANWPAALSLTAHFFFGELLAMVIFIKKTCTPFAVTPIASPQRWYTHSTKSFHNRIVKFESESPHGCSLSVSSSVCWVSIYDLEFKT